MSSRLGFKSLLLSTGLILAGVQVVAADITVTMKMKLIGGQTITRPHYYTNRWVRVTAPDGREFMFDRRGDSVTVINHTTRTYWTGPRVVADTIAAKIIASNRQGVAELAADPNFGAMVDAFNDSIKITRTLKQKKIAGYPCDEWVLTAGSYLTNVRWIARSLDVPDYGPEMQKVVMASVKDPLGRQLMRLLIGARTKDGLPLAGSAKFRTLGKAGDFSFQATKVKSGEIPLSAWAIPAGYTPIQP